MNLRNDRFRRILGLVFLGLAMILLVCGLTVFAPRLEGVRFILYWLACYCLTSLALLVAFFDAWLVRARARRDEEQLVRQTFGDVPPPGTPGTRPDPRRTESD